MKSWKVKGEVEKLIWNHLIPEQLLVSLVLWYVSYDIIVCVSLLSFRHLPIKTLCGVYIVRLGTSSSRYTPTQGLSQVCGGGGGGVFVSTCMLLSPVYINTCEYGNFHDCRTVSESPGTWVVGNWQC